MFARKKPLNPVNRQTICRPWCSSGIWGDLGMKSNLNNFIYLFFIAAGEIQPCSGGWPCMRMRKWEFDPAKANPLFPDRQVLTVQIWKVFWGFCPDVEKPKYLKLLFILMSSALKSRALIPTGSWDVPVLQIHSSAGLGAPGTFQALEPEKFPWLSPGSPSKLIFEISSQYSQYLLLFKFSSQSWDWDNLSSGPQDSSFLWLLSLKIWLISRFFSFPMTFPLAFFWLQIHLASWGDEEIKAARPELLGGIWVMVLKHFRAGFVAVSLALCPAVGTRAPSRITWNQEFW